MPPKKKEVQAEPPPLIGRVGTNLKVGIVGLPNIGKTILFNVLTKSRASTENFAFSTIDPNENRIPVPDTRWEYLCEFYKPPSKVPAFLNVVDISGLVKGASEGQGLGNAFLSHISACDAIFHLTRCFEDDDIAHVEGDVNPVRDLAVIFDELRLKDIDYLTAVLGKIEKNRAHTSSNTIKFEHETVLKILHILNEEKKHVRFVKWNEKEIEILNKHLLLTAKPMVYIVNLSEQDYIRKKNKWLPKIKAFIDENDPGAPLIPFSGSFESKLIDLPEDEAGAYLKLHNSSSVMEKIIKTGYKTLNLEYFFTVGEDEVKAWTIQQGTKAPQAGGRIHTDFERGFIMAEVTKFEDLKSEGSEAAVKAAGKCRQQGRNYIVEDGDIILFKFNAGAGLKSKKK